MTHFSDKNLTQAWASSQLPATFSRADRVRLLGQFAVDALAGREPSRESLLFLGGALQAWLSQGGSLERDYLKVTGLPGSHQTAAAIWSEVSSGGAQDDEDPDTVESSSTETTP